MIQIRYRGEIRMRRLAGTGILTIILSLSAIGVLDVVSLTHPDGYSDAFAPYAALMPGQPITSIPTSCQLQQVGKLAARQTFCRIETTVGPFRSITAAFAEGQVQTVWLRVQGLAIGDLVRHWGQPDGITNDTRYFYLSWQQGLNAVIEPVEPPQRFSFITLIKQLTVTLEPQPS
jgi:hypothetical protein